MAKQRVHLSPRERQVLRIVGDYLKTKGQQCFSYEGIYAYYEQCCRDQLPAMTLDRVIRRLAEKGVLERRRVKPTAAKPTSKRVTVIFCWTDAAESLYNEIVEAEKKARKQALEKTLEALLGSKTILTLAPKPGHELEFFATQAPEWWPYQLMTLGSLGAPRRGQTILLDNNAFKFYKSGEWPDINRWIYELKVAALKLAAFADEVRVVLPDKPKDYKTTFEWHSKAYAVLCNDNMVKRGVKCMAVAHFDPLKPVTSLQSLVEHVIETMPNVEIIAAPVKLYCAEFKSGRSVASDACVLGVIGRVANVVKGRKPVHALAPPLKIEVLQRIAPLINSFDTTSWTRPIATELRRLGIRHSAKNLKEREIMFAFTVAYLHSRRIPLRSFDLALSRLPEDLLKALGLG